MPPVVEQLHSANELVLIVTLLLDESVGKLGPHSFCLDGGCNLLQFELQVLLNFVHINKQITQQAQTKRYAPKNERIIH